MHRRLARGGTCPTAATVEAAIQALPLLEGFGGQLTVLPSGLPYRPLEVCAPRWMAPAGSGRVRLVLFDLYCPVFPTLEEAYVEEDPASAQREDMAATD